MTRRGRVVDCRPTAPGRRPQGRVLAVWQGDQVVAACCWHLHEQGPPVIFDLGSRTDVPDHVARAASTVLLSCLRDIAAHPKIRRDAESLRWSDRPLDRLPAPDRDIR